MSTPRSSPPTRCRSPRTSSSFQDTADLSGDPARPGFIVVAPEGRATTHFYPAPDDQGSGWDNWYRQLDRRGRDLVVDGVTYAQNVDAATIDHFIDEVIATGKVDTPADLRHRLVERRRDGGSLRA